ncbi:TPA: YkvS family protein [Staphylococcus aureus]|nr:YkvS family protein [Staphylococcus aureus]
MTVAEVGNIVEFMDGLRGRVEKINDNSVIVDLTIMENFNDLDLPEKTVINHKRYKIVEQEGKL